MKHRMGCVAFAVLSIAAGAMAYAETKVVLPPGLEAFIDNLDQNDDGRLALSEWRLKKALFLDVDANSDGFVSVSELARKSAVVLAAIAIREYPKGLAAELDVTDVTLFDADEDGALVEAEHRAWIFAAADANRDRALDIDECEAVADFAAFAKEFGNEGNRVLGRLDRNRDGLVQEAEFKPSEAEFKSRDRNRDARLSPDEIDWRPPEGMALIANQSADTLLDRYDRDEDGKLDKGELPAPLDPLLSRIDKDGDGAAARDELDRALKVAQDYQLASMPPGFIERYDVNGDRKVGRKEYPGPDSVFARLDANGDGFVSKPDGGG